MRCNNEKFYAVFNNKGKKPSSMAVEYSSFAEKPIVTSFLERYILTHEGAKLFEETGIIDWTKFIKPRLAPPKRHILIPQESKIIPADFFKKNPMFFRGNY